MMSLKKNDKIIVLIGVVIIIVAAIGIVIYTAPEPEDENGDDMDDMMFDVTWMRSTGREAMDGEYVGKGEEYTKSIGISAPDGSVLAKIEVEITWEDDVYYRGLLSKGLDMLSAEVKVDGLSQTEESTGSGTMTYSFTINSMPSDEQITADSEYDAEQDLMMMYDGENEEDVEITASVQTGEKMRRLLKFIRDKGNAFDIEISYEYYEPDFMEVEHHDDDNDTTGLDDGNMWMSTVYQSLSFLGRT